MKRTLSLLILVFVLFLPGLSHAYTGTWKSYPYMGSARDIAGKGDTLWVATDGGLLRLDIRTGAWTSICKSDGLPGLGVSALRVARNGGLWAGLESTAYNGVRVGAGIGRLYDSGWGAYFSMPHFGIGEIYDTALGPDGSLWFAMQGGVMHLEESFEYGGASWHKYTAADGLMNDRVETVAVAPDRTAWFGYGSYGGGVTRFDGSSWTTFNAANSGLGNDEVHAIATDRSGMVWFGTETGAARFDGSTWMNFPLNTRVLDIVVDKSGVKWFATTDGVRRFDGSEWTAFKVENSGLAGNDVVRCFTAGNTIWFAVKTGEGFSISSFDGAAWKTRTPDQKYFLAPKTVRTIYMDRSDMLWVNAPEDHMRCFDGSAWHVVEDENAPSGVLAMAEDRDNHLWIAGLNGVASFNGSRWSSYGMGSGLPQNQVRDVLVDRNGVKWFGAVSGLYRYDGLKCTKYDSTNSALTDSAVTALAEDRDGVLWIASGIPFAEMYADSVYRFNGHTLDRVCVPNCGRQVTDIAVDRGNTKWFATGQNVLIRYDDASSNVIYVPINDFLAGETKTLFVDSRGWLWVGCRRGAAVFDGSSWTGFEPRYTGLLSYDVRSIAEGPDGTIWFGTVSGLASFTPDSIARIDEKERPSVYIPVGNHPNPFNPSTTITFSLAVPGRANLTIRDITGRNVRTLVSGYLPAGSHSVFWDGRDARGVPVSSGIYLSRLESGKAIHTGKMLLVK